VHRRCISDGDYLRVAHAARAAIMERGAGARCAAAVWCWRLQLRFRFLRVRVAARVLMRMRLKFICKDGLPSG